LSSTAAGLVEDSLPGEVELRDLAAHRLKDLGRPEVLFQLVAEGLALDFPALRSLNNPELPNNLPGYLSAFIGREAELADVRSLIESSRLVTLTGAGGSGKTRLALQVAAELLDGSGEGVWFVDLAPITESEQVPGAVAAALGLREQASRSPIESLLEVLQNQDLLIVLDNCEHVIDACAKLADLLERSCPKVHLVATSREPLGIDGEHVYRLRPLSLPSEEADSVEDLEGSDAVELFVQRARMHDGSFVLEDSIATLVSSICRRLDGIPFAIELAAGRLASMSLVHLNERLDQRFRLLTGGTRNALPRQQTLQATVDWSFDLLSAPEQALFRRLSVFVGGFELEAAEAVCQTGEIEAFEVADLLGSLVNKSLVVAERSSGSLCYRLLEIIRTYAAERLQAAGEEPVLADRHATYYGQLAHDCAAEGERVSVLDRLEADHPNLLAALDHFSSCDEPIRHGQLASDLSSFWHLRGHWRLARRELLRYLGRADRDRALEGRCAHGLGTIAFDLADQPEAQAGYEEALSIARELGDRRFEGHCLRALGRVAMRFGVHTEARADYEEALSIAREVGDRSAEGSCVGDLGLVAYYLGDYPEARARIEDALSIARELRDLRTERLWIQGLAAVACGQGDYPEARARVEEAVSIAREVGDRSFEGYCAGALAEFASKLGDYPEARVRYEEALSIAREVGDRGVEGWWIGGLGDLATRRGDHAEARARLEEALSIAREVGERRFEGYCLRDLGAVASNQGDYTEAQARLEEALSIARELGEQDSSLLEACAGLLARLDRCEDAAQLLAAADDLNTRGHKARAAWEQARYDAALATCQSRLDQETLASASGHGRTLDWASAVDTALEVLGRD
jgi:predicted ATPase/Tfp pilus assembly protein PilF